MKSIDYWTLPIRIPSTFLFLLVLVLYGCNKHPLSTQTTISSEGISERPESENHSPQLNVVMNNAGPDQTRLVPQSNKKLQELINKDYAILDQADLQLSGRKLDQENLNKDNINFNANAELSSESFADSKSLEDDAVAQAQRAAAPAIAFDQH